MIVPGFHIKTRHLLEEMPLFMTNRSELIAVMMIGRPASPAAVRIIVDFLVIIEPRAVFLMQAGRDLGLFRRGRPAAGNNILHIIEHDFFR